ncbi:MAG: acyltransferase [Chitinophagales bacterium]|nr:acyltransferase [Chitinophagales bacterium]
MKVYFPNLNGLRFIAAMSVVVSHLEMVKKEFGLAHLWDLRPIKMLGDLGVILFFSLSGFLITYLLLMEKTHTHKVSIVDFYIRRVLRIWPLYFFLILLGLFIFPSVSFLSIGTEHTSMPSGDWWTMAALYLAILPNVAVKLFPAVAFIGHTWSIGVEEQFYYIWPWLVKLSKNILLALTSVIVFYLLMLFGLEYMRYLNPDSRFWDVFWNVWMTASIDCMAIGGIFAWLYFHQKQVILNILYHHFVHIGTIVLTVLMIALGIRFPILHHEIYAVLFSVIILNLSTNPRPIINLENKWMNYLGKVSYGIYMYHVLCIVLAYKITSALLGSHNNIVYYALSIALTILMSSISYEFLESKFIHLKAKFSKIVSGDNARKEGKS